MEKLLSPANLLWYERELWAAKKEKSKIQASEMAFLKGIKNVLKSDHIKNENFAFLTWKGRLKDNK